MPVNVDGRNAIAALVNWHRDRYGDVDDSRPLFPSRYGKGQQQMSRRTAHNVFKDALRLLGRLAISIPHCSQLIQKLAAVAFAVVMTSRDFEMLTGEVIHGTRQKYRCQTYNCERNMPQDNTNADCDRRSSKTRNPFFDFVFHYAVFLCS